MNAVDLQDSLCRTLCASVRVAERAAGVWQVSTPFTFPDGDAYSLYITALPTGGVRISDMGLTMMRLSYENDVTKMRDGTRGRIFTQILAETDLTDDDGEFYLDASADDLGNGVFRFGQALTRIHDLTFLNRARVESTFYEDLREKLVLLVGPERLHKDYVVPDVPRASDYPVDYFIQGGTQPLYLFGVPNRDKARLATIILQHLIAANKDFNSMIVFRNMIDIASADLSRLTNAANDMIASLDATDDFQRKILRRVR